MSDVTRLLEAIQNRDRNADEELLQLVYAELHRLAAARMANESEANTMSATALVHEAYLRLVGPDVDIKWNSRRHFFGAAAEAMRRILIDHARRKQREKRGGALHRVELRDSQLPAEDPSEEILAVHESLERFARLSPEKARLVELRYFGGLSSAEAAAAMDISKATADRYWAFARAWLRRDIEGSPR